LVVGGVVLPESGFGDVGVVVGGGLDFEVSVCPLVPADVRDASGCSGPASLQATAATITHAPSVGRARKSCIILLLRC
jgi:hypothetical protein